MLDDVSFINASGLVLRVGIRRRGRPPLAFFDRPDWIRAWFPGRDGEVIALCRRLNALLETSSVRPWSPAPRLRFSRMLAFERQPRRGRCPTGPG